MASSAWDTYTLKCSVFPLGLRRPVAELFRDVPWGGPEVCRITRERAGAGGVALIELDAWYDVDDWHGLDRLREHLQRDAAAERAPATARWLRQLDSAEDSMV